MKDLKRAKKLIFKFLVLLYFDVFAMQPDFLAQSVAMAFYSLVVSFHLQFLYME